MVFESIVADILNRYLGEYVENLDKGQLKIGIWGGKFRERHYRDFSINKKRKSIFHSKYFFVVDSSFAKALSAKL